jgi:hypothetical protein
VQFSGTGFSAVRSIKNTEYHQASQIFLPIDYFCGLFSKNNHQGKNIKF